MFLADASKTMDATTFSPSTTQISLPWQWQPVKRRMLPGCALFADGDAIVHSTRKFLPLDNDRESAEKENAE
jgi:hypothetical protein